MKKKLKAKLTALYKVCNGDAPTYAFHCGWLTGAADIVSQTRDYYVSDAANARGVDFTEKDLMHIAKHPNWYTDTWTAIMEGAEL